MIDGDSWDTFIRYNKVKIHLLHNILNDLDQLQKPILHVRQYVVMGRHC